MRQFVIGHTSVGADLGQGVGWHSISYETEPVPVLVLTAACNTWKQLRLPTLKVESGKLKLHVYDCIIHIHSLFSHTHMQVNTELNINYI